MQPSTEWDGRIDGRVDQALFYGPIMPLRSLIC